MAKLQGKVAVVTGASKGIGAAIAEKLAREGAAVVVNYSSSAGQAAALVEKIRAAGGKVAAIQADVSKPAEAQRLIASAVSEFGTVDVLVNNAGVYEFAPLEQVDESHYARMFDLNVKGLLFATQAATNAFGDGGGAVINISSVVSQGALPHSSVYSATKAAVDSLTRTLAAELGPKKVRVNSVLPGLVETDGARALPGWEQFAAQSAAQTPLGRVGQPEDISAVVAFLATSDSGWISGQSIPVAGGFRA